MNSKCMRARHVFDKMTYKRVAHGCANNDPNVSVYLGVKYAGLWCRNRGLFLLHD